MQTQLHESSFCEGIYHTSDERFYAAETQIMLRPGGPHTLVQYLSDDGKAELVRLYVEDLAAAQSLIEQVAWAEDTGRG